MSQKNRESSKQNGAVWGIVGGLGPLASAEFLKTIYEVSDLHVEQSAPTVIVYSDPPLPDRTASLTSGDQHILLPRLEESMLRLLDIGATRLAICCLTLHSVLWDLPDKLRLRTVSLVDLVVEGIRQSPFDRRSTTNP
jgi:aspartate racemase